MKSIFLQKEESQVEKVKGVNCEVTFILKQNGVVVVLGV